MDRPRLAFYYGLDARITEAAAVHYVRMDGQRTMCHRRIDWDRGWRLVDDRVWGSCHWCVAKRDRYGEHVAWHTVL